MEILTGISIFAFITLSISGLFWALTRPPSAATQRLERLGRQDRAPGALPSTPRKEAPSAFVQKVAAPLEKLAPASANEARKLQRQMLMAGFTSLNAPTIFRAVQLLMMGGLPLIIFALGSAWQWSFSRLVIWTLLAFVVGFFIPRFLLSSRIKRRQQEIRWGLADALDLMVVAVEAGMGVNASMMRVSDELKKVHPAICQEFELANLEMRVGREYEVALRNLADRTGVDDLRSFVATLIQADKFGTTIAHAVRVYADSLRTKRRQRAEQAAQKAAVKLLLPLACFLFPTLFIVVLGPAFLNLIDTFEKMSR
jgi:tight adherence protein C